MRERLCLVLVAFLGLTVCLAAAPGCATLGQLGRIVQPPRFEEAPGQPAEIRLLGPGRDYPLGGAGVRLWTRITNPNPFGFTLTTLRTTLLLDGTRAATGDFPLGLRFNAGGESVVPLDLAISFADVPGLASAIRGAMQGRSLGYQLDGTVGIDAGPLGQPTFGPLMLMRGDVRR